MTFNDWIYENLKVESTIDGDVINWKNGIKTPVTAFEGFFETVGQSALDTNTDVKQAILGTEIGKQFSGVLR